MESLNFRLDNTDNWKLTFHLPLHRYLSVFAYNAIYKFNIDPALFLPTDNQNTLLKLMFYPLRTIVRRRTSTPLIDRRKDLHSCRIIEEIFLVHSKETIKEIKQHTNCNCSISFRMENIYQCSEYDCTPSSIFL
jgi:hypothetical protein